MKSSTASAILAAIRKDPLLLEQVLDGAPLLLSPWSEDVNGRWTREGGGEPVYFALVHRNDRERWSFVIQWWAPGRSYATAEKAMDACDRSLRRWKTNAGKRLSLLDGRHPHIPTPPCGGAGGMIIITTGCAG